MMVREILEVVRRLEASHARLGEQEKTQALRELRAILQSHDGETVAAFVRHAKNGRESEPR
jgi:hypothetical protein